MGMRVGMEGTSSVENELGMGKESTPSLENGNGNESGNGNGGHFQLGKWAGNGKGEHFKPAKLEWEWEQGELFPLFCIPGSPLLFCPPLPHSRPLFPPSRERWIRGILDDPTLGCVLLTRTLPWIRRIPGSARRFSLFSKLRLPLLFPVPLLGLLGGLREEEGNQDEKWECLVCLGMLCVLAGSGMGALQQE